MREMKDSGVKWIREIPKYWNLKKYKIHCNIFAGGTPDTSKSEYYDGDIPWIQSGKVQNCNITDCSRYITKLGVKESSTKFIPKNTAVLAMTGATCGNVGYTVFDVYANQSVMAFVNDNKVNSRFIYYSLFIQNDGILINQNGSAQAGINVENAKNFYMPFPNIEEQKKIANFLDKKISAIESVIKKTKETIEDYKNYKQAFILDSVCRGYNKDINLIDSDDKWLGKIPSNYKIIKLNKIANIVRGGSPRPAGDLQYYDGDIPFMKISDITKDDKMYVDECKDSIKEAGLSRTRYIEKNTLLLTNSGATLGIPKINTFKTTFNDGIAAFMNLKSNIIDIEFAYYSLKARTKYFLEEASLGMGQPNLNTDIIGRTKIVLPEIKEQKEIVKNIKKKCGYIDNLIKCKEKIIEELEQYKKSLIYEYVTGKKEVI